MEVCASILKWQLLRARISKVVVSAWTRCTNEDQEEPACKYLAQIVLSDGEGGWFNPNAYGDCLFQWIGKFWGNSKNWREVYHQFDLNPITLLPWQEVDIKTTEFGILLHPTEPWNAMPPLHGFQVWCHKLRVTVYRNGSPTVYKPRKDGYFQQCSVEPVGMSTWEALADELESTYLYAEETYYGSLSTVHVK